MLKHLRPALVASVVAALFAACPPPTEGDPTLTVLAANGSLRADGTYLTIRVLAVNADQTGGSGTVSLSVDKGSFSGGAQSLTLTLNDGNGTALYSCDQSTSLACTGTATFTATWNSLTDTYSLTLLDTGVTPPPDGGNDGSTSTPGGDGGTWLVVLTPSKPAVVINVGDSAGLTAKVTNGGTPVANEPVTLQTNLGELVDSSSTPRGSQFSANTDATGTVTASLRDNGEAGTATVTATVPSQNVGGTATIRMVSPASIAWIGTNCGLIEDCQVMGAQGSGFRDQASMSFRVTDGAGNPVPGVLVSFDIPNGPFGTTVEGIGTTNSAGVVTISVTAGAVAGSFRVHAVVVAMVVETFSPTHAVTGAVPSNEGLTFGCERLNVPVLALLAPHDIRIECSVRLTDRNNNAVGIEHMVSFKSEAGAITEGVTTVPYDLQAASNADQGTGVVTFSTGGVQYPWDVAATAGEPVSTLDANRNPRDGLVTVIAYVNGEEDYADDNGNGQWDTGERFFDQGEPFVDANDNDVWDPGEWFLNTNPAVNTTWDGPNGTWDADTIIWTKTHVVYSGVPHPALARLDPAPFSGACGSGGELGIEQVVGMAIYFPDANMNRPAGGTPLTIRHASSQGSVALFPGNEVADRYGFGISYQPVDASGGACTPASTSCVWQTSFGGWGSGYVGVTAEVKSPATPPTACTPDTVTVSAEVVGEVVGASSSGAYAGP